MAAGQVPVGRGGKQTVAMLQYDLLLQMPYHFTQEDLLYEVAMRSKRA
ncbi:MAG TPA: DUF6157 family protein [Symbiobacteriaceae bacterium]|nr:DUF6157 family protein [Symbiobacteriaceae bacterium]